MSPRRETNNSISCPEQHDSLKKTTIEEHAYACKPQAEAAAPRKRGRPFSKNLESSAKVLKTETAPVPRKRGRPFSKNLKSTKFLQTETMCTNSDVKEKIMKTRRREDHVDPGQHLWTHML